MARLFISYKREDQDVAFAVRQWLMDEQGWSDEDIFVDLDKLRAGDEWAARLFTEAETAQAMLFLASEAALHPDSFCYRELRRARGQVLAVTLGGVRPDDERLSRALPYEALARQITSLDQQPAQGFEFVSPIDGTRGVVALNRGQVENIGAVLRDLGIAPDSFDWTPNDAGPYPGLPALQEGEEAIFCGRETDIRDGLRALEESRGSVTQKVYLIQAPSGAGKSSYLRAGLWQRLRNHASFTPLVVVRAAQGVISHPEWGLVSQLSAPKANLMSLSRDAIAARVDENLGGFLAELADADAGADGRRTLLLGIDQGEEISALEGTDREEFERLLSSILSAEDLDIRLVLTARDDSVDALIERLEGLGLGAGALAMNRLNRMSPQRYRDIIRGPAEAANRVGWPLQINLELEIALADAANQSRSSVGDALPLLAIALQRLVLRRRRPDGTIDLAPEDAQEFLENAIADTLRDALRNADANVVDLKTLLIPQLATWDPQSGEGGAAKRVVARDNELFAGNRASLKPLADALVDLRLLTRTREAGRQYHEVAHEALLRVPPMDNLLYETRETYIHAQILRSEAAAWAENGERDDHLARAGDRLKAAQALVADPLFGPTLVQPVGGIARYLAACEAYARLEDERREALREDELKLANERAEAALAMQHASERVARRTRFGLVFVSILFFVAAGAGWLAVQRAEEANLQKELAQKQRLEAFRQEKLAKEQREEALKQEKLAQEGLLQAQINESRFLATLGTKELESQDYGNAIGLALMGLPKDRDDTRPLLLAPLQVLYDSIHNLKAIRSLFGHEGPVFGGLELSDQRLLTWSDDHTARLWDADGRELRVLRGHESSVLGALELSDGRLLTWGRDNVRLWTKDGGEEAVLRGHKYAILGATELSGGRILTWASDGAIGIWSANGKAGKVISRHTGSTVDVLKLSDGRFLTLDRGDGLWIWSAGGDDATSLLGADSASNALKLSDGRFVVWGAGVKGFRLLNEDGTAGPVLQNSERRILEDMGWPRGAIALLDGRLLIWDDSGGAWLWGPDGSEGPALHGHKDWIRGASELSDRKLLTWSDDGKARLWGADGSNGPVISGHDGGVTGATELSDGRLVTWGKDATVRLWSSSGSAIVVLRGHDRSVDGGIQVSDGRLMTWSSDGSARLWRLDEASDFVLHGHENSITSLVAVSANRVGSAFVLLRQ